MEGNKELDNKIRFELIDPYFTEGLACVLTHGAAKYGADNWKVVQPNEYISALERHWNKYRKGIIFDDITGLFHLDHIAANTMFLRWSDRFTYETKIDNNISKRTFLEGL